MKHISFLMLFILIIGASSLQARACKFSKIEYNGQCLYAFKVKKLRRNKVEKLLSRGKDFSSHIDQIAKEVKEELDTIKKSKEGDYIRNIRMRYAADMIVEIFILGGYEKSISLINSLTKFRCQCEEDSKITTLKNQLDSFGKIMESIVRGLENLDYNLILNNINAAKNMQKEIAETENTRFNQQIKKIRTIGHLSKALFMEKKEQYLEANTNYEKCRELDPYRERCQSWFDRKDETLKKIYSKAELNKSFNPERSKELMRIILKLSTPENEYYKKAEKDIKKLEKAK